ncbi:MAG TPA: class I SAM-dependent methyltransferase [Actinospica sp.]|nr:class I SAM-dependent methyltransferase [Actinospica sp.]
MTISGDRAAYLDRVRTSYDEVAVDYAAHIADAFPNDRLGRGLLDAFAGHVRAGRGAPTVLDVGCGPGHVTAHLATLGLEARGIDLSKRMVELARREYPALRFDEGDMTELDVEPESLGGALLWFSTHHLRPDWLPAVFAGCARALRPDGTLLLGTHIGAGEHTKPSQAYGGHPVSYESFLQPVEEIDALVGATGLRITSITVERPDPRAGAGRAGARIFARKD